MTKRSKGIHSPLFKSKAALAEMAENEFYSGNKALQIINDYSIRKQSFVGNLTCVTL